jgi:hypothetical protein
VPGINRVAPHVELELPFAHDGFEEIAQGHGLEKIKTVGDPFMATVAELEALVDPTVSGGCSPNRR